ncbi:MAG: hypothetical protein D6768_04080 [Chloroflexi bacterium]|nr:MAG: hypothetical protein D6768_04080 [Chloroflexota bacterium]
MDGLKNFAANHPQISSWVVLAIGMVIILVWSARDVGFTGGQWAALVVTTILLAGACVWIIGWEDDEDDAAESEPAAEAAERS